MELANLIAQEMVENPVLEEIPDYETANLNEKELQEMGGEPRDKVKEAPPKPVAAPVPLTEAEIAALNKQLLEKQKELLRARSAKREAQAPANGGWTVLPGIVRGVSGV